MTRAPRDAACVVGVTLLDHVVVARGGATSLARVRRAHAPARDGANANLTQNNSANSAKLKSRAKSRAPFDGSARSLPP